MLESYYKQLRNTKEFKLNGASKLKVTNFIIRIKQFFPVVLIK